MPTVGITIEPWKLPIFRRHLTRAGYTYKKAPGVMGTIVLSVEIDTPEDEALGKAVQAASIEAASTRKKRC